MSAPGPIQRLENGKGGRNDWRTPPGLFKKLDDYFHFTIDGAASVENALCERYYDEEMNAFQQLPEDESIFVNPPYGKDWKRWISLFEQWGDSGNTVVALVPSATDTEWWAMAYESANDCYLLSGRVKFINPETGKPGKRNTTGSTVFIWSRDSIWALGAGLWDWRNQPFDPDLPS